MILIYLMSETKCQFILVCSCLSLVPFLSGQPSEQGQGVNEAGGLLIYKWKVRTYHHDHAYILLALSKFPTGPD